jgi:hypothetical protein
LSTKRKAEVRYPRFPPRDWRRIDDYLGLPTDAELKRFAEQMNTQHAGKPSSLILSPHFRIAGLICERHVARVLQIPMPLRLLPHGNRRVAFWLNGGRALDVIGRKPPKGSVYPDLTLKVQRRSRVFGIVLVCFNGFDAEPEIVGWEEEAVVEATGFRTKLREEVENYVLSWRSLRSVSELAAMRAPNHPLAGTDERPFYWNEGRTEFTAVEPEPAVDGTHQESLF